MIKKQVVYKYTNRLTILILILSFVFILTSVNTVSADSSVIYVNVSHGNDSWDGFSWETAKLTIKNATGTVTECGTVNIADGVYTGAGNTNININKNMTIKGQSKTGTIINGTNSARMFYIQSGKRVAIQSLTLANGNTINYPANYGAAIYNDSTLTINSCTFTGNTASSGGAILNYGNLTIIGSTFTNNTATSPYPNSENDGGAIYNSW